MLVLSATKKQLSQHKYSTRLTLTPLKEANMMIGSLTLVMAGAFTGASFYLNYVEQPARMKLSDDALIKEWEPSDHRGFILLAGLALLTGLLGFIAYRDLNDQRWLYGALMILGSLPYTYLAIVPLNDRILGLIGAEAAHEARSVIRLWGALELGQTLIGLFASASFIWASN